MSSEENAIIAIALTLSLDEKKKPKKVKKQRRTWSKEWLKNRKYYTHENLLTELRNFEKNDFKHFLRMDDECFDEILALVNPFIKKQNTSMREAIPASQRLSITLRYLATGNTFEDLKFVSAISPQSIGNIVIDTCEAIIYCLRNYIKLPKTPHEWKTIADEFEEKWDFPHCLGSIDGKHVTIKKPPHSGSFYFNYKNTFSIVLLALVNANYEFLMVDVGLNGRISDGGVLGHSDFGKMMENQSLNIPEHEQVRRSDKILPYVFVADDAFAMNQNLLKPYSHVGNNLTEEQRRFNYRLSRARRIVENAFGILVSRFGVLQKDILLSPEKSQTIVLACCHIHNYLRSKNSKTYISQGSVDFDNHETGEMYNGAWRNSNNQLLLTLQTTTSRSTSDRAKRIRDMYSMYFSNEGAVPWQNNYV